VRNRGGHIPARVKQKFGGAAMQLAASLAMKDLPEKIETRRRTVRPGVSGSSNAGRPTSFAGAHRNTPINHAWMEGPVQVATQLLRDPTFANIR